MSLCALDAEAEVEGAPGAPLDVRCLDANKDYIIVTWKQPAVDGGGAILGYFVDRSVSVVLSLTEYLLLMSKSCYRGNLMRESPTLCENACTY